VLAGLTLYYDNFQNSNISPEIFELCAQLMKNGADRATIIQHLGELNKIKTLGLQQEAPIINHPAVQQI
jgi:nanoRNase/pAp phosphatase (c-di-AMP/oligoRNAs hydrolase)